MEKQSRTGSGESLQALREALREKRDRIQKDILSWAANNLPRYPWRQPGRTPYEVLIGEVCLRETAPVVAVRAYHRFLQHFISIRDLAEAREDDLIDILSISHLQQYAHRIRALAENLLKAGKGHLPGDSESFARVCGLEYHSVKAIMCFGYGFSTAVIDSNAVRMLSRLFGDTLPSRPAPGLLQAIGESLL